MAYNPPMLRLVVPVAVVLATASAAQAAWLPPLKPSAARKKPVLKAVAGVAGRPAAKPTPRPTPRPTPVPTPIATPTPAPMATPEAADPTPDPVHPAARIGAWRLVGPDTPGGQAQTFDGALWQGDWALAAALTTAGPVAGAPAAAGMAPTLVVPAAVLRRRLGGSPATLTLEAGWTAVLPVATTMGMAGATIQAPVRTRWFLLEGTMRGAGGPNGVWYGEALAGFRIAAGPASLGLGWRHLTIGVGGSVVNLTGPEISGALTF